ncbi:ATP-binding cassette domain-containing protein [Soonwooa sp.]|uniref:ATP-binding cassette domain-containing protein n=1 Tax=Soonwooa sp. TaxID=1938592 RepID=UPI00289F3EAF|nr:ATP-binding cassette domain-containing protein [Soonwooa sp.]
MFTLHNITYLHPDKEMLFHSLNFTLNKGEKVALIGQNGVGKSTLLKLISGEISPYEGEISSDEKTYFAPQIYGQLGEASVAEALKIDSKLKALHQILGGDVSEENFEILNDDWDLENRVVEAFSKWKIENISLSDSMKTLSGGQKTKVLLAGIDIDEADFVILDEPSNHLDFEVRQLLYNFVLKLQKPSWWLVTTELYSIYWVKLLSFLLKEFKFLVGILSFIKRKKKPRIWLWKMKLKAKKNI